MRKALIFIMAVALPLIMAMPGTTGEFYQYTDEKGNLVFTDDISIIPEGQRPEITTHEAVRTEPEPEITAEIPGENPEDTDGSGDEFTETDETGGEFLEKEAEPAETKMEAEPESPLTQPGIMDEDELDREKARLDALFEELQAEKQRLNDISMEKMNNPQRNVHQNKINNVNMRIRAYYREVELFQKKVNEYNVHLRQQAEAATRQQ